MDRRYGTTQTLQPCHVCAVAADRSADRTHGGLRQRLLVGLAIKALDPREVLRPEAENARRQGLAFAVQAISRDLVAAGRRDKV